MQILTFEDGPFLQNTYAVLSSDGTSAVLIDAGAGTSRALDAIEAQGRTVQAILLTHAHLDHVDGLAEAKRRTGALSYLHPSDRPLFDAAAAQAQMFGVPFEKAPPPDQEIVPGEALVFGGDTYEVRFAPGHAPGHVVFVVRDAGLAFVGDVIFAGSIGRTDLPGGDLKTLMTSIRQQVLTLPDDMRLLTGHGPETRVDHERNHNPFLVPQYGGEFA